MTSPNYPQYPDPQGYGEAPWQGGQPAQYGDPYAQQLQPEPQPQYGTDPYATPWQPEPQYADPAWQYGQQAYSPTDQFGSDQGYQPLPAPYAPNQYGYAPAPEQKSKAVAALLAFFLGSLGVHNFYLGNTTRGAIQLGALIIGSLTSVIIVGLFLLIPLGIWVFVEFIMILIGSGDYATDANGIPLRG